MVNKVTFISIVTALVVFSSLANAFYFNTPSFAPQNFQFKFNPTTVRFVIPNFSVVINDVDEGFADRVRFTISSNVNAQFDTSLIYTAFDRITGREFERRERMGQRVNGESNYVVQRSRNVGRVGGYRVEICRNNQCVQSNAFNLN